MALYYARRFEEWEELANLWFLDDIREQDRYISYSQHVCLAPPTLKPASIKHAAHVTPSVEANKQPLLLWFLPSVHLGYFLLNSLRTHSARAGENRHFCANDFSVNLKKPSFVPPLHI